MRVDELRVLVVGAGLAGLATARTLRDARAVVEVVERSPEPSAGGTGIYLPGNAIRALRDLGLEEEVADRAEPIERQRFSDQHGRRLFEVPVEAVWSEVAQCLALPRADLLAVLLAGVDDVPISWGTGPKTLTFNEREVAVELDDGSVDEYDLVLGADGVHSTVRRLAFEAGEPRPVGQYARRFVVAGIDDVPGVSRTWSVLLGRGTSFLTIPIGGGRLYCYCDGPAESAQVPLRDLLAGYAEPVPTMLGLIEDDESPLVQEGLVEEVVLESWSRDHVLLIGDAAHATSPNMAQGAAMGFEDAIVLAQCLIAAEDLSEAVTAYEQRRRPRTDWVLRQTHKRDRARNLPTAFRNVVLTGLGQRIFHGNYRPLREQP